MASQDDAKTFRDHARRLGLSVDGDDALMLDCPACGGNTFQFRPDDLEFHCADCSERVAAPEHLETLLSTPRTPAAATQRALQSAPALRQESAEIVTLMTRPETARGAPLVAARPIMHADTAGAGPREGHTGEPHDGVKPGLGEALVISFLSLVFLCAGLLAAGMSGFANYQAFGAMVEDPLQSRVWAWTGIIASLCSFGGFTFVYWHWSQRRVREGLRAAIFALAGAATSLVGTQMYMANTEDVRLASARMAQARSALIASQVEDWRSQIEAIPPDVRSVEGLEAYIAEVERVGLTHQKPYRDARNELGLARRRASLEGQIEVAREELLELGSAGVSRPPRPARVSWFFAAMLEVFSSQGTSIGFVALMILAGRRRG